MKGQRRAKPRSHINAEFKRLFYANTVLAAFGWMWWNWGWRAQQIAHMGLGGIALNLATFAFLAFCFGIIVAWIWLMVMIWLGIIHVARDEES